MLPKRRRVRVCVLVFYCFTFFCGCSGVGTISCMYLRRWSCLAPRLFYLLHCDRLGMRLGAVKLLDMAIATCAIRNCRYLLSVEVGTGVTMIFHFNKGKISYKRSLDHWTRRGLENLYPAPPVDHLSHPRLDPAVRKILSVIFSTRTFSEPHSE